MKRITCPEMQPAHICFLCIELLKIKQISFFKILWRKTSRNKLSIGKTVVQKNLNVTEEFQISTIHLEVLYKDRCTVSTMTAIRLAILSSKSTQLNGHLNASLYSERWDMNGYFLHPDECLKHCSLQDILRFPSC